MATTNAPTGGVPEGSAGITIIPEVTVFQANAANAVALVMMDSQGQNAQGAFQIEHKAVGGAVIEKFSMGGKNLPDRISNDAGFSTKSSIIVGPFGSGAATQLYLFTLQTGLGFYDITVNLGGRAFDKGTFALLPPNVDAGAGWQNLSVATHQGPSGDVEYKWRYEVVA